MTRPEIIAIRDKLLEDITAEIRKRSTPGKPMEWGGNKFDGAAGIHAMLCRHLEANDFPAEMKTTALAIKVDEGKLRTFITANPASAAILTPIADDLKLLAARGGVV